MIEGFVNSGESEIFPPLNNVDVDISSFMCMSFKKMEKIICCNTHLENRASQFFFRKTQKHKNFHAFQNVTLLGEFPARCRRNIKVILFDLRGIGCRRIRRDLHTMACKFSAINCGQGCN